MGLKKRSRLIVALITIGAVMLTAWVIAPFVCNKISDKIAKTKEAITPTEEPIPTVSYFGENRDPRPGEDGFSYKKTLEDAGFDVSDTTEEELKKLDEDNQAYIQYALEHGGFGGGVRIPDEEQIDKWVEEAKNTPSDIEGYSVWEKMKKLNLDGEDGSDTDHDGLTDKEEIEVYKSDPLNRSTAGDLYEDGYKVANGMDPTKYYDFEGDPFPGNEISPEYLTLETKSVINIHVTAWEYDTPSDWMLKFHPELRTFLHAYRVSGYAGKIRFNIGKIINLDGWTTKDILDRIEVINRYPIEDVKVDGEWIEFDYDSNLDADLLFYLRTEKGMESSPSRDSLGDIIGAVENGTGGWFDGVEEILATLTKDKKEEDVENNGFDAVAMDLGLSGYLFRTKPLLLYAPSGDDLYDKNMLQLLVSSANDQFETLIVVSTDREANRDAKVENCNEVSRYTLNVLKKILKNFPDSCHQPPYGDQDEDMASALFRYFSASDLTMPDDPYWYLNDPDNADDPFWFATKEEKEYLKRRAEGEAEAAEKTISYTHETRNGFSWKYEFPFTNFSTPYSAGVCAGLATLTAYNFNNGKCGIPKLSGEETLAQDGTVLKWNINSESDVNDPLIDGVFGIYLGKDFTPCVPGNEDFWYRSLSSVKREYVNLTVAYWDATNDAWREYDNGWGTAKYFGRDYYDADKIMGTIREYINNGKILTLGMNIGCTDAAWYANAKKVTDKIKSNGNYFVDTRVGLVGLYDERYRKELSEELIYGGHAVNIIDWIYDKKDPGISYLLIYDNNIPAFLRGIRDKEMADACYALDPDDALMVKEAAAIAEYGTVITVEEKYDPYLGVFRMYWRYYSGKGYYSSSDLPISSFELYDENMNIIAY